VQNILHDDGKLFRYEKENETGYNIMLNKSTVLFAALISTTLPTIGQGAEKTHQIPRKFRQPRAQLLEIATRELPRFPQGLKAIS